MHSKLESARVGESGAGALANARTILASVNHAGRLPSDSDVFAFPRRPCATFCSVLSEDLARDAVAQSVNKRHAARRTAAGADAEVGCTSGIAGRYVSPEGTRSDVARHAKPCARTALVATCTQRRAMAESRDIWRHHTQVALQASAFSSPSGGATKSFERFEHSGTRRDRA